MKKLFIWNIAQNLLFLEKPKAVVAPQILPVWSQADVPCPTCYLSSILNGPQSGDSVVCFHFFSVNSISPLFFEGENHELYLLII